MLANELTDSSIDPIELLLAVSRSLAPGPDDATIFEDDTPPCCAPPLGTEMCYVSGITGVFRAMVRQQLMLSFRLTCSSQPPLAIELRSSVTCGSTFVIGR